MSDMENEKIFVVVPVYKVEPYLDRCIGSILNQTCKNWELVLVDDGSPDNCGAICDRYAAEYDNITVIRQENGGVSAARNAGIDYALTHGNLQTDWINFIDSDDFVHPKYLEYLHRAAVESGTKISSCAFVRTSATEVDPTDIGQFFYDRISPEAYLCQNPPNANVAWGKLYRLSLFQGITYPVGKLYEDDATTHKLLFPQPEIAVISVPLYYWYLNHESISASSWSPKRIDKLDALEAQLAYFQQKGFDAAYRSVVRSLFLSTVLQFRDMQALSPRYSHLRKEMNRRQIHAIKLHIRYYGFFKTVQQLFDIRIRRPLLHALRKESFFSLLRRKLRR